MAAQLQVLVADAMAAATLQEWASSPTACSGTASENPAALVAAKVWPLEQAPASFWFARAIAACSSRPPSSPFPSSEAEVMWLWKQSGPGFSPPTLKRSPADRGRRRPSAAMTALLPFPPTAASREPLMLRVLCTRPMAEARTTLGRVLGTEPLQPPTTLLLTSADNRYSSEPGEIREESLSAQLTEPVRYQRMVERLVRDGIGVVIEAGPRSVPTGLHRRIPDGEALHPLSSAEAAGDLRVPCPASAREMNARPACPASPVPAVESVVIIDRGVRRYPREERRRGPGDGPPAEDRNVSRGRTKDPPTSFPSSPISWSSTPATPRTSSTWTGISADLGIDSIKRSCWRSR